MIIEEKLNIPAAFFYKSVLDSVIFDVQNATGKRMAESQLQGLEYVKKFGKNESAKILIEKLEKDQAYKFQTITKKNAFTSYYQIIPIDEKSCRVVYEESMASYGTMQKLNDMLLGIVLGFFKRRQFKKMLKMIETSY